MLSIRQYSEDYQNGDYNAASKAALDVGVGFYAILGGPYGVGAGLGWWAADLMGAFEGPPSPTVVFPITNIYRPGEI